MTVAAEAAEAAETAPGANPWPGPALLAAWARPAPWRRLGGGPEGALAAAEARRRNRAPLRRRAGALSQASGARMGCLCTGTASLELEIGQDEGVPC